MKNLPIFVLFSLLVGCGSSNSRQTPSFEEDGGEGGLDAVDSTGGTVGDTGGYTSNVTGGTGGSTGGINGSAGSVTNIGGSDAAGATATGGAQETGGSDSGGEGGDTTGGSGNVGGGCEPWDCTNLAIDRFGWDSSSGELVPEICGLVQDPCTGQYIDCGGCDDVTHVSYTFANATLEHYCGIAPPILDELSVTPGTADPNSCNPQCQEDRIHVGGSCAINELPFSCSIKDLPPHPDCTPGAQVAPGYTGYIWCCPDYQNW